MGPRGPSGVTTAPLSIVWRCALSVSEYAAAGRQIEVSEQACPDCGRQLTRWSGYLRPIRCGRDYRIWIRRGRCWSCKKTHALLPDFVHERRYDAVEVIGRALELGIGGLGMEKVAVEKGVPHSTARDWRRRHRARAPALIQHLAELASRLGAVVGELPKLAEQAALALLEALWQKARERLQEMSASIWRFWNAVCGGRALGTNTNPPLLAMGGSASIRG